MKRARGGLFGLWRILLIIHSISYIGFFIYSIEGFRFDSVGYVHDYFIALLFWLPILLVHVAATYRHIGRGDVSAIERQAYREGLADAMQQLNRPPDTLERLALNDESELVEMRPKRKRG